MERPVPTSCGRAVKYVVYTLTIKSTIGQANQELGQTTDSTLAALRQRLIAKGGELHMEGCGYGPLIANIPPTGPTVGGASPARDVVWGPHPRVLKWDGRGQLAAYVEWECDIALAPCDNAKYAGGILEYVYGITTSIDKSGYTRRTIKGSVSIPQTRASVDSVTLSDHADRLREQVTPAVPGGFRRASSDFDLSQDKCKLDFSFVDEEVGPNYLPEGVVEAQMSHSVTSPPYGQGRWKGMLTATYEMVRGVDRSLGWTYFRAVLANKAEWARSYPLDSGNGEPPSQAFIITQVTLSEPDVYGKKAGQFAAQYTFMASLATILNASGLWRTGSVPSIWATSLSKGPRSPWSPRGNAGLKFDGSSEAIIDLCHQPGGSVSPPATVGTVIPPGSISNGGPTQDGPGPYDDEDINDDPDPDASWLWWESDIRLEQVDDKVILKPLPPPDFGRVTIPGTPSIQGPAAPAAGLPPDLTGGSSIGPPPSIQAGGSAGAIAESGPSAASLGIAGLSGGAGSLGSTYPSVIIQERAAPTFYAYLTGCALRVGYPISPPMLTSVGGAPAIPMNRPGGGLRQSLAGNIFGVPVYRADWNYRYVLAGVPSGTIPLMDSPFG